MFKNIREDIGEIPKSVVPHMIVIDYPLIWQVKAKRKNVDEDIV